MTSPTGSWARRCPTGCMTSAPTRAGSRSAPTATPPRLPGEGPGLGRDVLGAAGLAGKRRVHVGSLEGPVDTGDGTSFGLDDVAVLVVHLADDLISAFLQNPAGIPAVCAGRRGADHAAGHGCQRRNERRHRERSASGHGRGLVDGHGITPSVLAIVDGGRSGW